MPYKIGEIDFRTKDDIGARCRAILKETPDNYIVDENHLRFLFELFKFHDEWDQKSIDGVKEITTQTTEHGTRCFALVKRDGKKIDISFPHSIKLIPTKRTKVLIPQGLLDYKSAARTAIKTQIFNFRDQVLSHQIKCPYTGVELNRDNCAIDHTPPLTFDRLLFDFTNEELISPLEIEVGSRNGVVAEFVNKSVEAAWQKYHQENAELRAVSKIGNLQLSKVPVPWEEVL
ncbi:MAG: DCL family protein [Gammaproteobacteria bacterium]|nr:DCL family protein [Gammaproteobacteria bacterium]